MPYDPDAVARQIGAQQYKAMSNLWADRTSDIPYGAPRMNYEMNLGPYGQQLLSAGNGGDYGTYGQHDSAAQRADQTALTDLFSLRNAVNHETDVYEYGKAAAQVAKEAKRAQAQAKNQPADGAMIGGGFLGYGAKPPPTVSPSSSTGGGVNTGDYKTPADAAAAPNAVEAYIRQAATDRGIDPDIALRVARSEGGTEVAKRGTFATGSSWWPFQLHYGGKGYEQLGTVAGMGNSFTAQTGFQPGDPAAWRASVDYALDRAKSAGWGDWYGARAQGITGMMGIGQAPSKPAPAGSGQPFQVNRTSQFGLGLNRKTAEAFCGPAAAIALAGYYGNNIPVEEAQRLATQVGWNVGQGMAGPASQVNLLHKMGVKAQSEAWNDARAQQLIQAGTPVIIDTPGHYFLADQYDPNRGYRVGTSGTDLREGGEWLTPAQMRRIGIAGSPRTMIYA